MNWQASCYSPLMQYFGGKQRIVKALVPFLQEQLKACDSYSEPFVGGCSVFSAVVTDKPKQASDFCEPLIALYQHVQQGGELPSIVTEEDYQKAKRGEVEPWLRAFIGFGCSFAGKWFGGYARGSENRNYASNAKNSLLKKFRTVKSTDVFVAGDFQSVSIPNRALVYCDPPYAGTTGYNAASFWNPDVFWQWVRDLSKRSTVLVSEYKAPEDFKCVLEIPTRTDIRTTEGQEPRIERLFTLK